MNRLGSPLRLVYWFLLLVSVLSISGAAAAETGVSVSSANFGSVQVGSSLIRPIAVVNAGRSTVTISQATASGSGFKFVGPNLPITLYPYKSANFSVSFTPQSAGAVSGGLKVTFSAPWGSRRGRSSSATGSLSGTGAGAAGFLSTPSSMSFGSIAVGSSQTQALALSNTGGATLTISAASVTGNGFRVSGLTCPYSLAAGASANLSVTFSPTTSGTITASLAIASNAANPTLVISLSGTGAIGTLSVTPGSMSFGSVSVGSSQTQALTLSNTGGSSFTISAATVTGGGFTVSGLTLPYTLAASASANLSVTFSPTSTGANSASLAIASNAANPSVTVALSGTATTPSGTLALSPGSMSFGSVTIGTTQTQSGNVSANGGSITLSSASSNNSAFTLNGLTLPMTLAAGQSVPFTVTFAPTASGAASAKISFFASNATSASETATGSGATVQHRVELSWSASTSTSVAGYNVYRATSATGSYSRINTVLNPSMNYSDGTVQSGQSYYYVTTAVDSSGVESTYSNQVQAVVPFP